MATEDMHYIQYNPDEIWKRIVKTYIEEGGDILYPGDEKEILLRAVLALMVQDFAVVDNALLMDSLSHTMGRYMDIYGEKRDCYRLQAQAAQAVVEITFGVTGVSRVIPAGTELTADGQRIYVTQSAIQQTGYAQVSRVGIAAQETGAAGNGLAEGTSMQFCATNAAVTSIVVTTGASGGRDREDDDNYRERIREYGLASITTGPRQQYEQVAREVSPDVLDARAVHAGPCQVTVYLIIDGDADAEVLKTEVLAALSAETERPMTDLVTIEVAEAVEYVLNVTCSVSGSISTGTLDDVIKEYQAWQDNEIQRPFNPDKLLAMLYQAGVTRVQWGEGSHFGGGAVEYTELGENQHCQGVINLTISM